MVSYGQGMVAALLLHVIGQPPSGRSGPPP